VPHITSSVVVTPLRGVPDDRIVFDCDRPGAALLEGWSDDAGWRVLLPWPDDVRQLAWSDAHQWKRELDAMERDTSVNDAAASIGAPFLGGWVGFIAYEAAATEEAARPRDEHPPEPPLFFAHHRAGIVVDPNGAAFLFAPVGEAQAYVARIDGTSFALQTRAHRQHAVRDSLDSGRYAGAVETIRTAIRDGDVYQVNLTRALTVTHSGDAAALYRALTGAIPPRMSAFIRTPRCVIASASPEVLLQFDRINGVAETRPIKGTVRRQGDDAREIAILLDSAKDAAEHLMIVDVSRNDLGKVAPPGCVSVTDYRRVRTLESVHHLESAVKATGLRDCSIAEVLGALSPAASITGAPKRAAVQMIRHIEPVARGVYCGSIGFITSRKVEMSVAIRTAIVTADEMRYHAGGGIVWDSNADAEDDETRAKSAAFLRYASGSEAAGENLPLHRNTLLRENE
jgi:anthranilate/para-aminobenzoate synthase component I